MPNFSFAAHADDFDRHIRDSIPGLSLLSDHCVRSSRRFIQSRSTVLDIGCSTGRLLRAVCRYDRGRHDEVKFLGLDLENKFNNQWGRYRSARLDFQVADVREFTGFDSLSLAFSAFTIQFLPERDKLPVLQTIFDAMLPGGALIVAEKVFASSARLQDALTFPYYDRKRKFFSASEILNKEQKLRGQMTLWSEDELRSKIRSVGFGDVQTIWSSFPFMAVVAMKQV